jgi:hypothetical protein
MRDEDDALRPARGCITALSWCGAFWLVLFAIFLFT